MQIIVCIDDDGGMLFHQRRQSRDRVLVEDILEATAKAGKALWISSFSERLFGLEVIEEMRPFITVADDFLDQAQPDDFCFVENRPLKPYEEAIGFVTVYRWNRKYPADTFFDIDLEKWQKESSTDFTGSSHEKITREIYRK